MEQELIILGASVSVDVLQWLEDYRAKKNTTMSRIFQDAVEEYLKSRQDRLQESQRIFQV